MILGLDISTSITGICVLDKEKNIVLSDFVVLKKGKDIFEKGEIIKKYLLNIKEEYDIEDIIIEKSLQTFRSGFSSAKTLSLLASFNGLTSWFCYDIFKKKPEYVSATSARKIVGIKVPKGKKGKEVVYDWVVNQNNMIDEVLTRTGKPKPHMYDQCDAIVVALSAGTRDAD
tara:strand:- start:48 stop:563 length:516 start_codon:yes stop_codon:yes gene_type:complete